MVALNPPDSVNETEAQTWEGWNLSEPKRVMFLSEKKEEGGGLCRPSQGDTDRLKTGIYGRGLRLYVFILQLALHETLQGQPATVKGNAT